MENKDLSILALVQQRLKDSTWFIDYFCCVILLIVDSKIERN